MSLTAAFVVFVAVWLTIGLVASLVMGRRGHAPFTWGMLGTALGPLLVPMALGSIRRERQGQVVTVGVGGRGQGPVDVLVGIDGSSEAAATLRAVIDLLGARIGRLVLARVTDYDTAAGELADDEPRTKAIEDLRRGVEAGAVWLGRQPETALLAGSPAAALEDPAQRDGFDVLAVGSRGRGASAFVFGSVATRLAQRTAVPVLIVSAAPRLMPRTSGPALGS